MDALLVGLDILVDSKDSSKTQAISLTQPVTH
jgi:hypothetical protein